MTPGGADTVLSNELWVCDGQGCLFAILYPCQPMQGDPMALLAAGSGVPCQMWGGCGG